MILTRGISTLAKFHEKNALFSMALIPFLAACGGGGSGANQIQSQASTGYEKLHSMNSSSSNIVALFEANASELIKSKASFDHNTQTLTHEVKTKLSNVKVLEGLDYVGSVSFDKNGKRYNGYIGIPTAAADMPKGTFTYQGKANAVIKNESGSGVNDLTDGNATTTLKTTGTASLTTVMKFATNANYSIDTIEFKTSAISGSGFSGGTVSTYKDGAAKPIVRSEDQIVSQVQFFGPSAVNVAGQVLATKGGGDNSINATFYAVKD